MFLVIAFFSEAHPAIQVMSLTFLNTVMILYQGSVRPLLSKLDNTIELTNEFLISICSIHMMFFTDAIAEATLQYDYGKSMCAFILLLSLVNVFFILYFSSK